MKSLEEVIEILGKVVKHDYVWFDERTALMTDTLQYLRELRNMTDIPMEYFENSGTSQILRNTSQITCPKCHSEFVILDDPDGDHAQLLKCQALLQDFYRNDPLTWGELKQMEGKPVWMENGFGLSGDWELVQCITKNCVVMIDGLGTETCLTEKDISPTRWQAYRKERS